jgi:RND family efflux transporter MFP subunit
MNLRRYFVGATVLVASFVTLSTIAVVAAQTAPGSDSTVLTDSHIADGIGMPSEEHRVTFEANSDGSDIIKEVKVKPGDMVKAGDVLMTEDQDEALDYMAILKAAAEATGEVQEAQVTIDAKTQVVKMYADLVGKAGGYSQREMIDAQLDLDVAKAKLQQANETHQQRQLEYVRQQDKVQHMTLLSPIDGVVEKVGLFAGEAVNANTAKDGAVYIVSNNPLWVEFHIPASQAAKLKLHDKLDVSFADTPDKTTSGEVIFLDPMVEYVGQLQTVRVSIANPDYRPSGLHMDVHLPQALWSEPAGPIGSAQP